MKNYSRLFDIPYFQLETHPLEIAFADKRKGQWLTLSTAEFIDKFNRLSRGLLKMGVKPNDKIAVSVSNNCTEWCILDQAVLQLGAQNVPIYSTCSDEDFKYILNHSEAKYIFVSDETILEKINAIKDQTQLIEVFGFKPMKGCKSWEEIFVLGEDKSLQKKVEERMEMIQPGDMATLIYTSGTTGKPKGVMLSHHNIISNLNSGLKNLYSDYKGKTSLSFLPICHVFERFMIYYYNLLCISVYFAESLETIGENLKEVKPTIMSVVPRVLEKVYSGFIYMGSTLTGTKKKLFDRALNLAAENDPFRNKSGLYRFKLAIANKLIFSKWKAAFGGNLEIVICGSALLRSELIRVYCAADMDVFNCYGLTETSPGVSANAPVIEKFRLGSVGKVYDEVNIKIAEDGEVLIKGPNVMMGYFKDPEATKNTFTDDGYFKSGDLGSLDDDNFLFITGRKKEVFKTSGGKFISPQKIEEVLMFSPLIEQVIVVGENQKMPAAIIQPDFTQLKAWCNANGIVFEDDKIDSLLGSNSVKTKYQNEIDNANKKFGQWEQIKDFRLTPVAWSIDGGELTPTLKIRRKQVMERFKNLYDDIYA